jgi:hypothetical protein
VPVPSQIAAFYRMQYALTYVASKTCIELDMVRIKKKNGHRLGTNTVPLDLKTNALDDCATVALQMV